MKIKLFKLHQYGQQQLQTRMKIKDRQESHLGVEELTGSNQHPGSSNKKEMTTTSSILIVVEDELTGACDGCRPSD